MDKKILFFLLIYPLAIGAANFFICQSMMKSELAVRPPIAVVDEATFIQQNLKPGATTQDLEQLLLRSEQAATTLTENGYLVLRKNQVFSSPAEIEAKP
ncbi:MULTISPECIES: hypothetical protein [Xanthomonas]|uniref:Uncharacterized protein n=1 Tax=Xanthomonas vesicatoria TaxID=56460 RepID=A0ABS8L4E5_9XANT|nr:MULTISPECIES: hypothetical protein [Xanthomonas]APO93192.1 hypothetical protein BI313_00035 [Xanthomonas vesicatoria]MBD5034956.1 hypothetical protein [Xanthomonas citri pv. citri]MBD5054760.1 hypothetical protein [Xanthomonas citri pv. citri]MCC8620589.1 hypothetical protein [Xanthomonas vesicatoria]MCC8630234.1 hypothetical protein [Xanthomonas vesicatoria]